MLPNLMVIGAMKAGTTSLHAYLDQHPDIFMSKVKELDFFVEDKYRSKDWEWYKQQFPTEAKIRGEASQNYTKRHHPDYQGIPQKIQQYLPEVKLIYIVRDPIERYSSHFVEAYYGDTPKRVAFNRSIQHFEKTSLYFFQLEAYLEQFSKDQIFVLALEDLQEDPLREMNRLFRFLEVEEMKEGAAFNVVKNSSADKTIPFRVKRSLIYRGLAKVAPGVARRIFSLPFFLNQYKSQGAKPLIEPAELLRLKKVFEKDVNQLRALTGLPLDKWQV